MAAVPDTAAARAVRLLECLQQTPSMAVNASGLDVHSQFGLGGRGLETVVSCGSCFCLHGVRLATLDEAATADAAAKLSEMQLRVAALQDELRQQERRYERRLRQQEEHVQHLALALADRGGDGA